MYNLCIKFSCTYNFTKIKWNIYIYTTIEDAVSATNDVYGCNVHLFCIGEYSRSGHHSAVRKRIPLAWESQTEKEFSTNIFKQAESAVVLLPGRNGETVSYLSSFHPKQDFNLCLRKSLDSCPNLNKRKTHKFHSSLTASQLTRTTKQNHFLTQSNRLTLGRSTGPVFILRVDTISN